MNNTAKLISILLLFTISLVKAQNYNPYTILRIIEPEGENYKPEVLVFRTYNDYKDGKGEKYDKYHSYLWVIGGTMTITFIKDGAKVKIKCKDIWGFKINSGLYRIDEEYKHIPVRVICVGNFCHYENGLMHLDFIKTEHSSGQPRGYAFFISKDLNSKIVALNDNKVFKGNQDEIDEFDKTYPEAKEFLDCLFEKIYSYYGTRSCIADFEKKCTMPNSIH